MITAGQYLQDLRTQLHKDGQEQQELLDQQHDVIQQLQHQQEALKVQRYRAAAVADLLVALSIHNPIHKRWESQSLVNSTVGDHQQAAQQA